MPPWRCRRKGSKPVHQSSFTRGLRMSFPVLVYDHKCTHTIQWSTSNHQPCSGEASRWEDWEERVENFFSWRLSLGDFLLKRTISKSIVTFGSILASHVHSSKCTHTHIPTCFALSHTIGWCRHIFPSSNCSSPIITRTFFRPNPCSLLSACSVKKSHDVNFSSCTFFFHCSLGQAATYIRSNSSFG